jgi:hypothetical protein
VFLLANFRYVLTKKGLANPKEGVFVKKHIPKKLPYLEGKKARSCHI